MGLSHSPSLAAISSSAARPCIHAEVGRYRLRLAQGAEDREAACRLRFQVFNIELGEGLERSYETGIDTDQFDVVCEHLMVEDKSNRARCRYLSNAVGEYGARHHGLLLRAGVHSHHMSPCVLDILELGRASIDREHRTPEVLTLFWRGIAQYATDMGLRYFIGCSSFTSKDPAEGWQLYRELEHYRASPEFETWPTERTTVPSSRRAGIHSHHLPQNLSMLIKVPKLLKTYLTIGARISAPPAWDRGFGTIDFLTLLDLKLLSPAARSRFLAPLTQ